MTNQKLTAGSLVLAMVSFHGLESSYAFQVPRKSSGTPSKIFVETDPLGIFDDISNIDIDVAEDCANNFGKYSFEEIEHCRDELHARRVQNLAVGEDMSSPEFLKERFLEVELTMQLDKLKHEMPESYLFPEEEAFDSDVDTNMDIDGLLMDNGLIAVDLPPRQDAKASDEMVVDIKKKLLWEELAAEGLLEPLAICAFLGFVILLPNLF